MVLLGIRMEPNTDLTESAGAVQLAGSHSRRLHSRQQQRD